MGEDMNVRCIYCGKEADYAGACLCPDCGYKMFPMPYDRKVTLRQEICGYLRTLLRPPFNNEDVCYYRIIPPMQKDGQEQKILKEEDDRRFPDFEKLRDYICGAKRTEIFRERLDESIAELRKHLRTPYQREYHVDLTHYHDKILVFDKDLESALRVLSVSEEISAYAPPAVTLRYTEMPDKQLTGLTDSLLVALEKLSIKIEKFIRQNNIYGTAYQLRTKIFYNHAAEKSADIVAILSSAQREIDIILDKQYKIDLLSDGSQELDEMLTVLWNVIAVLMEQPILKKSYAYTLPDGNVVSSEAFSEDIADSAAFRCPKAVHFIERRLLLSEKTEDELFELYDELIAIDNQNLLGMGQSVLIKTGVAEQQLQSLIGLKSIKESILKIKAYAIANRGADNLNLHMCFYGNPGTGKTEVARLMADILYENKILPTTRFVEVDRSGLIGQYVGETPQKTMRVIQQAMGGVLFIDEAYALVPKDGGGWDYGHEAVATLIKAMEDLRGKFCVILAGYKNEMEKMLSSNPGFASRIQFTLYFPNYSRAELKQITKLMLSNQKYTIGEAALQRILDITDITRKKSNFANAREIRNILDQVIMCQSMRVLGTDSRELGLVDVEKYISNSQIYIPKARDGTKALTGEEELERLIGLAAVKRMVKKIRIYAMRNHSDTNFNLHMCFYGNPGTGKTEVARILARILYDAGILKEAKLVETDAYGLLGKVVGETAPKTLSKIDEADGGVLFIDEAYALTSPGSLNMTYGSEAIAVLLKEMEDRRGRFCVIFAGYKNEMKSMLSSNPGLESRIQFKVDFPDYTREELGKIVLRFLEEKSYTIEINALERVLDIAEYVRPRPNFANARTIRNIIDQVLLNQNLRTENESDSNVVVLEDVEDYLADEGIDLNRKNPQIRQIGF